MFSGNSDETQISFTNILFDQNLLLVLIQTITVSFYDGPNNMNCQSGIPLFLLNIISLAIATVYHLFFIYKTNKTQEIPIKFAILKISANFFASFMIVSLVSCLESQLFFLFSISILAYFNDTCINLYECIQESNRINEDFELINRKPNQQYFAANLLSNITLILYCILLSASMNLFITETPNSVVFVSLIIMQIASDVLLIQQNLSSQQIDEGIDQEMSFAYIKKNKAILNSMTKSDHQISNIRQQMELPLRQKNLRKGGLVRQEEEEEKQKMEVSSYIREPLPSYFEVLPFGIVKISENFMDLQSNRNVFQYFKVKTQSEIIDKLSKIQIDMNIYTVQSQSLDIGNQNLKKYRSKSLPGKLFLDYQRHHHSHKKEKTMVNINNRHQNSEETSNYEQFTLYSYIREIFAMSHTTMLRLYNSLFSIPQKDRQRNFVEKFFHIDPVINNDQLQQNFSFYYFMDNQNYQIVIIPRFYQQQIELSKSQVISKNNIQHPLQIKEIILLIEDVTQESQQFKARQSNQYKFRMLSSLSHELRTPLNCSISLLRLAKSDQSVLDIHQSKYINPSLNSNQLLLCGINDVLDLANIDHGEFSFYLQQFSFIRLLDDIVGHFKQQIEQKQIDFRTDFHAVVIQSIHSDPERIQQILVNLISNSIKFTQAGFIQLTVEPHQIKEDPGGEYFQICVSDSGCGFNQDQAQQIFNNFGQTNPSTSIKTLGSGIGLTISNKLAIGLSHGIPLKARSEPNKLTEFFLIVKDFSNSGAQKITIKRREFMQKSVMRVKLERKTQNAEVPPSSMEKNFYLKSSQGGQTNQRFDQAIREMEVQVQNSNENRRQKYSKDRLIEESEDFKEEDSPKEDNNRNKYFGSFDVEHYFNSQQEANFNRDVLSKSDKISVSSERERDVSDGHDIIESSSELTSQRKNPQIFDFHMEKSIKEFKFKTLSNIISFPCSDVEINIDLQEKQKPMESIIRQSTLFAEFQTDSKLEVGNVNSMNSHFQLRQEENKLIEKNNKNCDCVQILIVDDNEFNVLALDTMIKSLGFTAQLAYSGEEAVNQVSLQLHNSNCCQLFRLIFMDIDMPEMDGFQTTILINEAIQSYTSISINTTIFCCCSAYNDQKFRNQATAVGMTHFIPKPIDINELSDLIEAIFG